MPYLLREWDSTKGYLFKNVFNSESLILSRHVSFTKNEQQIATDIGDAWDRSLPEGGRLFYHQFHEFCAQMRREISQKLRESGYDPFITGMYSEELEKPANQWWRCQDILDTQVLAANEIQEEFTIDLPKPDGTFRKYHVQKGSRPMRVVGRILKAYHFAKEEDYKELVNWHSRMLNDKRLEGELCLSIHPLDYMTMSENNCDWTSCMNWPEGGCYRGGTIEMMNSPMVIVAYLKSANNPLMMDCGWDYSTGTGIHNREVILECLIPWLMTLLLSEIDVVSKGTGEHDFITLIFLGAECNDLLKIIAVHGFVLLFCAIVSLLFGTLSGRQAAIAASGFAKNLRKDMYYKIQDFSFSNIDKFSTSSLVTRLTTDITNVEMAYMMLIRIAVRSPFMMIFSMVMAFSINARMALIFLCTSPVLIVGLTFILKKAVPFFSKIFPKYDAMNEAVEVR